jgi:hypothetical protein
MDLRHQLSHLNETLLGNVKTEFPDELLVEELTFTRSYLVLAHAVLEEHLEDIFRKHCKAVVSSLSFDLVPYEAVLLAFAAGAGIEKKRYLEYKKRGSHDFFIHIFLKDYEATVVNNHGLKSSNVEGLAKPLGINWLRMDGVLNSQLADLNTLGSKRGAAGHLSPFTEKATVLAANNHPDELREWVRAAMDAVDSIEQYLRDLLHRQGPSSLIADWDGN